MDEEIKVEISMSILLSIVIPTYNGEKTLRRVLLNISSQIVDNGFEEKFEIVVTDDYSTDKTVKIVQDFCKKYPFIHLFKNKINLGMDKNFVQCMRNARGKYVWFCGQDDEIKGGLVAIVDSLLAKDSNIQNIYLDFSQCDEKREQIICQSMINRQLLKPSSEEMLIADNSNEYFSLMSDSASFLPATIVKKDNKLLAKLEPLMNTHYVQYAYFTLGLDSGSTIIFRKQLILGPIPTNGWQKNGNKLYQIAIGKLYAQYLLNTKYNKIFPTFLLQRKKTEFAANYFKLLLLSLIYGLSDLNKANNQLFKIFNSGFQKNYISVLNYIFRSIILVKKKLVL